MQKSIDGLRWTIAAINLAIWVPWLVYVVYMAWFVPIETALLPFALAICGLLLGLICIRAKPGWELRALIPLVLLIVWAVFVYFEVTGRSLHSESGCAPCSVVDFRLRVFGHLIDRHNYARAFDVLWSDLVLSLGILLTTVLLGARNLSRMVAARGKANAT